MYLIFMDFTVFSQLLCENIIIVSTVLKVKKSAFKDEQVNYPILSQIYVSINKPRKNLYNFNIHPMQINTAFECILSIDSL